MAAAAEVAATRRGARFGPWWGHSPNWKVSNKRIIQAQLCQARCRATGQAAREREGRREGPGDRRDVAVPQQNLQFDALFAFLRVGISFVATARFAYEWAQDKPSQVELGLLWFGDARASWTQGLLLLLLLHHLPSNVWWTVFAFAFRVSSSSSTSSVPPPLSIFLAICVAIRVYVASWSCLWPAPQLAFEVAFAFAFAHKSVARSRPRVNKSLDEPQQPLSPLHSLCDSKLSLRNADDTCLLILLLLYPVRWASLSVQS